ncbi:hypothetical protein E0H75_08750 [Kribbella capetownensis]|uniref:2'-5' RNA ligase family protein n=1 Tax=Kribbella capetownensis TaxID=1572659 RepID=A0A4V2M927_9ACTN|nr:hypothetical protein [Kribbella capetownensis]TCC53752.1 hypothetical protein E0H75_08750 [Kribbella capetownensis]
MTKFDDLFTTAAPLIARGDHQRDEPPREGGRWPVSVVLRPPTDSDLAQRLDAVTTEAAELAGPGHWQTGQLGSAHLTVRALEGYRATIAPDDPAIERYLAAVRRATAGLTRFRVTGLTLTPGSVMACAIPLDGAADAFLDRFATELGPDDWFERPHCRRDIWYLNLLHFTSEIPNPLKLIDWVAERRTTTIGEIEIAAPELVHFCLQDGDRAHMRPIVRAL